jgi:uncharacterized membrane protein
MSLRFFLLGGILLIVVGGLQALVRPREPNEVGLARVLNRSNLRAAVFVMVGVLAVLVGAGVIPVGGF